MTARAIAAVGGLFRKELRVAFTTPVAYVVLFAFACIASLFFWMQLLEFERTLQRALIVKEAALAGQLDFNDLILSAVFANLQIVLLFTAPLLTMRAIAEERQRRTFELLLTSPMRAWEIAAAKYGATFVVLFGLSAFLLVYPLLLTVFGEANAPGQSVIDWGQTFAGILGVLCAGALFAAVGFAFSCLTASPALAALLAFVTLVFFWFLGGAGHEVHGPLGDVLTALSPASHVERMARGILHVADLVYYASGIALFFFLGCRAIEARRWAP